MINKSRKISTIFLNILLILTVINILSLNQSQANNSNLPKVKLTQPKNCSNNSILKLLRKDLPSATIIKLERTPAKGTFLDYITKTNGKICSYGSQSKEIGITLYYKKINNRYDYEKLKNFHLNSRKLVLSNKKIPIDAEIYEEGFTNELSGGRVIKNYNIYYLGYYIKVESTFFTDLDQASPYINSALNRLTY